MIYKQFQDKQLSSLGMGCMRLPTKKDGSIDELQVKQMLKSAFDQGINYIDTARWYHDGWSEVVMGKALKDYPRESYYVATKFPGYDLENINFVEKTFEEQLKRMGLEYFDFYLFHNVCELNINQYLDPQYRIFDYLLSQKKAGRIKHLGFSTHGSLETMKRFLDAYGKAMEFCQIQLNWLDYDFQNAKAKIELINSYNIPIWVMEPLRGGALVNLAPEHEQRLKALRPNESLAGWAFRFLQTFPTVTMILSGMSNNTQMQQNIKTFETSEPLNEQEFATLIEIAKEMTSSKILPCTKCKYCTTHCPKKLDIPWIIELYNEYNYSSGGFLHRMALQSLDDSKKPSACLGCGECEKVCPQNIKIRQVMKEFSDK